MLLADWINLILLFLVAYSRLSWNDLRYSSKLNCDFFIRTYIYLSKHGPQETKTLFQKMQPNSTKKSDFISALKSCDIFTTHDSKVQVSNSSNAVKYLLSCAKNVEITTSARSQEYTNAKTFEVSLEFCSILYS